MNTKLINKRTFVLNFSLLMSIAYSLACSPVEFESLNQQKLSKEGVFAEDQDGNTSSAEDTVGNNNNTDASYSDAEIEINRTCSNAGTKKSGNLILARRIDLRVSGKLADGSSTCLDTKDFRSDFINLEKMKLTTSCPLLRGKSYKFEFFDLDHSTTKPLGKVLFSITSDGRAKTAKSINVVYAANNKSKNADDDDDNIFMSKCESFASPLVVKLNHNKPLVLSSPTDGILYDILGDKALNQKKQISWPIDDTIAFISLPNASGEVLGINELFGDNTMGPDGELADNGYMALAKYDLNEDRMIDKEDVVYSKLQLFIDRNQDGASQPGELYSLSEYGIQSVDLNYDPNYSEVDQYGNRILYKSVAQTESDVLLVFDIWFRLIK